MPTWVFVVLAIVAVLVAGLVRERLRMGSLETWARQRGFTVLSPFTPGTDPPIAALAARLEGRDSRRWGVGLEGKVDDLRLTFAEHETAASGQSASGSPKTVGIWRVMVAWPVDGARKVASGALEAWPHDGQLIREGPWAAWRVRGNLTPALVERMIAHLPEARHLLG